MNLLHDNVLVTEDNTKEKTTSSGLILTTDIETGNKAGIVVAVSDDIAEKGTLQPRDKVYLHWKNAMPVEIDGLKCGIVSYEDIKLVMREE
jgi:co-chaperonin GroES (HSP10)